jgi:rhodanese-related sulfurtransferase
VGLHPTHGAGSFCSASAASSTTSTIGDERTSPPLSHDDAETFADSQLAGLAPYPSYYARMGPINLGGPTAAAEREIPLVDAGRLEALIAEGVVVIDARPKRDFADGHIPGSWGIELGTDFTTWVGWLVPFESEMVLIVESETEIPEAVVALSRIGVEAIVGAMVGLQEWTSSDRPVVSHATTGARELLGLDDPQILDVRAPDEWSSGYLDGSILCYLPDLVDEIPASVDRTRPVYVGCATGHRASTAAGLLSERGYEPVVVLGASLLGAVMLEPSRVSSLESEAKGTKHEAGSSARRRDKEVGSRQSE